ncbi:hypothetical protein BGX38DRAFT_177646 [Terfezia claveryi]|nr:hypothetical protein BGX38DRAFT_177646 [Terfezia claveryi]
MLLLDLRLSDNTSSWTEHKLDGALGYPLRPSFEPITDCQVLSISLTACARWARMSAAGSMFPLSVLSDYFLPSFRSHHGLSSTFNHQRCVHSGPGRQLPVLSSLFPFCRTTPGLNMASLQTISFPFVPPRISVDGQPPTHKSPSIDASAPTGQIGGRQCLLLHNTLLEMDHMWHCFLSEKTHEENWEWDFDFLGRGRCLRG